MPYFVGILSEERKINVFCKDLLQILLKIIYKNTFWKKKKKKNYKYIIIYTLNNNKKRLQ